MSAAVTIEPAAVEVHGTTYVVAEERQIGNVRLVLGFREWVGDYGVERTWIVVGLRFDGSTDGGYATLRVESRAREMFATSIRDRRFREAGTELPGRQARLVLSEINFSRRSTRREER